MTISMDAAEVMTAIEVASWVGSILAMLVIGLIVYLMVRPSRRSRERRRTAAGAPEAEEMLRLIARMEHRIEVLERVIAQDARNTKHLLEAGEPAETRRTE